MTDSDGRERLGPSAGDLRCLKCGARFQFEDLGAIYTSADDRAHADCPRCGAPNEVLARPQPGPGKQPKAETVGLD